MRQPSGKMFWSENLARRSSRRRNDCASGCNVHLSNAWHKAHMAPPKCPCGSKWPVEMSKSGHFRDLKVVRRNVGFEASNRDCPDQTGTVGTYDSCKEEHVCTHTFSPPRCGQCQLLVYMYMYYNDCVTHEVLYVPVLHMTGSSFVSWCFTPPSPGLRPTLCKIQIVCRWTYLAPSSCPVAPSHGAGLLLFALCTVH